MRSLTRQYTYQSSVPYLSSGYIDEGEVFSFSGIKYHINFMELALQISGAKKDILIRIPVSEIAPILLFSKKDNYVVLIAPFFYVQ